MSKIPDNLDDMFLGVVKGMHRDALDQRQEEKTRWIATARALFQPAERRPCTVCRRYRTIAQAHHIIPLGSQFDRGFKEADHTHVWLCPNHHVVVHRLLTGADLDRDDVIALLEGSTQNERWLIQRLLEESAAGAK
jgi:hypothetical protein